MDIWASFTTTVAVVLLSTVSDMLSIQQPAFLGCYKDKLGKIFEGTNIKQSYRTYDSWHVVYKCIEFCRSAKYRYAGAKFNSHNMQCFCGDVIQSSDPTSCEVTCPGNGKRECAGPKAIGLYDTRPCAADPCKNGAVCKDIDADNYKCTCTKGWKGVDCDEVIEDRTTGVQVYALIMIPVVIAVVVAVTVVIISRRRKRRILRNSHRNHSPATLTLSDDYLNASLPTNLQCHTVATDGDFHFERRVANIDNHFLNESLQSNVSHPAAANIDSTYVNNSLHGIPVVSTVEHEYVDINYEELLSQREDNHCYSQLKT